MEATLNIQDAINKNQAFVTASGKPAVFVKIEGYKYCGLTVYLFKVGKRTLLAYKPDGYPVVYTGNAHLNRLVIKEAK